MKIQKQNLFRFLKRLNKQLVSKNTDLKVTFQKDPPPNNQIKKKFIEWRSQYDQLIVMTLREIQQIDQRSFNFKDYIVKATQQFGHDTQFLELLRNVNNTIENLKQFIRINLIRDPSIYQIKD